MVSSIFFVWMLKRRWEVTWLKYIVPALVIFGANLILQMIGILRILKWWDYLYCIGASVIMLLIADTISKRLWKGPAKI